MLGADKDKIRAERARDVALFRYAVISEVLQAEEELTHKQRGALVRHIAGREHKGPDGKWVTVSRWSIDRWVRIYKAEGFTGLLPTDRNVAPRTDATALELAFALKKEKPARTAAQVAKIVKTTLGDGPAERTLQTHFARAGLNTTHLGASQAFGRFEAEWANDRWTGDALHGRKVAGAKTLLFAYLDDHSRKLVGYRWVRREDTLRAESALRPAIATHGVPLSLYLDNGSPFVDGQLKQTLAHLGTKLVHSRPGRPQGRGKIERFFKTVRDMWLVEVDDDTFTDMDSLNRAFTAWVETEYHQRLHSETEQTPQQRWEASWAKRSQCGLGGPRYVSPEALRQAFLFSEYRTVTKTATISMSGNTYEVDQILAGRRIEVRFDPFDLTKLDVYLAGKPMGVAVPHIVRAHVHNKARPDETTVTAAPTGICYLDALTTRHEKTLSTGITFYQPTAPQGPTTGAAVEALDADADGGLLLQEVIA